MKYRVLLLAAAFLAMTSVTGFAQVDTTGDPGGPSGANSGRPEGAGVSPFDNGPPEGAGVSPFDNGPPEGAGVSPFDIDFPGLGPNGEDVHTVSLGPPEGAGVSPFIVNISIDITGIGVVSIIINLPIGITVDIPTGIVIDVPMGIGQLIHEFVIDIGSAGVNNPRADGGGFEQAP